MTLHVFTSRLWLRDPDTFDITRGQQVHGARRAGSIVFAPSKSILVPALEARSRAKKASPADAAGIESEMWSRYAPAYRDEMRRSYREHRAAWDALLARERVVLTCYCALDARLQVTDLLARGHCHRVLLAGFLVACGAVYGGEIAIPKARAA